MKSVWTDATTLPSFHRLDESVKTDVLIIGGGIAGVLCAFMLKQAGVDYILAEANNICGGITKNTTAKITSQHGLIYDKLLREFGVDKARAYLRANEESLQKYSELCKNIDCDFVRKDNYVYSVDDRAKLEKEITALKKIGYHARLEEKPQIPVNTVGAVVFGNQAQLNPLKFLAEIAAGLNIYEHTAVRELIGTTAITAHGKIFAKIIIVATHFPFINKHGSYFIKMYQHRSYVIAAENAADVNGMYVDEAEKGMSFRNYKNLLLIGGGDHRTGKSGGNYTELESFMAQNYPNAKIKYKWAAQDCMTLDGIPYIGKYSGSTQNLYVATGFNKWGMTSAMTAASLLCNMVCGKETGLSEVFSPSRTIMRPQLAANAFEAVKSLLTPTKKRCPHMGCALKWNKCEHTWDCPCHGSRFTADGKLIDNPSTGDIL